MANPNAVNTTEVYGNNALVVPLTSATVVANNPASSGKLLKINTVMASNVSTTGTSLITLNVYSADDLGGTAYSISKNIVIPDNASVVLIDSDSSLYLKEDESLGAIASGNTDVNLIASWDEISDV